MRLFIILAVFLAVSRAKEIEKTKTENKEVEIEDSEAVASAASLELLRDGVESLDTAASTNNVQARQQQQRPPWANYIPSQFPQGQFPQFPQGLGPVQFPQVPSGGSGQFPGQNYQNYFPINNYFPNQPQKPQNDYVPPQNNPAPPQNNYAPPENNYVPQAIPSPPQNDYYRPPPNNPPTQPPTPPTTTEKVTVIKNEQYTGENGNYKYEYQTSDGTWVGEEGYVNNPNTENAVVVKKGWYSYTGADKKQYTVTWWADDSGYHAFGEHLPTPPPIPPEIQAALDQAAKEEAEKAEAEKNKPVPLPQPQPQPGYPAKPPAQNYPQYDPPQQNYPQQYPQQPTPQPQYPPQQYPQQQNPQPQYPNQQYPPQQYPQQQTPQQQYPQQQYPQQQNPPSYRPPSYARRGSRRYQRPPIPEE